MDLIVELKISNPNDWAIIQPLLKRLKIAFTQKTAVTNAEPLTITLSDIEKEELIQKMNGGFISTQFGDYEAADILMDTMKNKATTP